MSNSFKKGWYMIADEGTASMSAIGPVYCKNRSDLMKHAQHYLSHNTMAPSDIEAQPIKVWHVDQAFVMQPAVSIKKDKMTLKK